MKKILPWVLTVVFLAGIVLILTSDFGIVANYHSANIAGALLSCFSGVCLTIFIYFHCKSQQ